MAVIASIGPAMITFPCRPALKFVALPSLVLARGNDTGPRAGLTSGSPPDDGRVLLAAGQSLPCAALRLAGVSYLDGLPPTPVSYAV